MSRIATMKRKRNFNFTQQEQEWLLKCTLRYKQIVMSTNRTSELMRCSDWEQIAHEFNKICPQNQRTAKALSEKYTKLKNQLRKNKRLRNRFQHQLTEADLLAIHHRSNSNPHEEAYDCFEDESNIKVERESQISYDYSAANKDEEEIVSSADSHRQHHPSTFVHSNGNIFADRRDIRLANYEDDDDNEDIVVETMDEIQKRIMKRNLEMAEEKHAIEVENMLIERRFKEELHAQRMKHEAEKHTFFMANGGPKLNGTDANI